MIFTHKKHYIGNIISSKFYYKNAIFSYYYLSLLNVILPNEIIDNILAYICPSLVVFATNFTLHYINPIDNAVIKSIKLNKMRRLCSDNNTFAISEDGLTFYRIYRRHMELEYLCDEVPDPNKPPHKKTLEGNCYYYSYNIAKKCKFSTSIRPYAPMYGVYGGKFCLSSNGKYIAISVNKEDVINHSGSYITIYDAKTKTFFKEIKVDATTILSMSFSPDNSMFVAVVARDDKHEMLLWNTENASDNNPQLINHPDNVYFETLSDKIVWCQDSSKFAITFQRLDTITAGLYDYSSHDKIIGSSIFFGTSDGYFRFNIDNHINNITWIKNEMIAYSCKNQIIINNWNKLMEEDSIVNNEDILTGLTSSINGNLIIQSYKRYHMEINIDDDSQPTEFNINPIVDDAPNDDNQNDYNDDNQSNDNQNDNDDNQIINWGAPDSSSNDWGAPDSSSNDWGAPDSSSNDWGAPASNDNDDNVDNEVSIAFNQLILSNFKQEEDDYFKWLEEEENKRNTDNYDEVSDSFDVLIMTI